MNPKISVIMAIYNCENTVSEAIESILTQTFKDFELIICDDCSTDRTYEIVLSYFKKYRDKIILLRNSENSKLSYSLNRCLQHARGEYIARMDGDDISAPLRLEKQVNYLKANPNIQLVGTWVQRFTEEGPTNTMEPPINPDRNTLRRQSPFVHATIMTYKHVYDALNGYTVSEKTKRSQDIELYFRFYKKGFRGHNIGELLYIGREDLSAFKRRTFRVRWNSYLIKVQGYYMLNYPWYCFIYITFSLFKILVPPWMARAYRKWQNNYEQ